MKEPAPFFAIIRKGPTLAEMVDRIQGQREEARRILLIVGQARLGPPDAAVLAAVEAIHDIERLETLAMQALHVESWQQLFPSPPPRRERSRQPRHSGPAVSALHPPSLGQRLVTGGRPMIRKLKSGQYRLYSKKTDPRTGKRRNLGTFATRQEAEQHERAVQFFKHRH
jgi:hypothetical protein